MGKDRIRNNIESERTVEECTHHWYINTPAGSTSMGVCKKCGEEKSFRNSTQNHDYVIQGAEKRGNWGTNKRGALRKTAEDYEGVGGDYSDG